MGKHKRNIGLDDVGDVRGGSDVAPKLILKDHGLCRDNVLAISDKLISVLFLRKLLESVDMNFLGR